MTDEFSRLDWYLWFTVYFNRRPQKYSGLANVEATKVTLKILDSLDIPSCLEDGQLWFQYDFIHDKLHDHIFMDDVTVRKVCRFVRAIVAEKGIKIRREDLNPFISMFARIGSKVVIDKKATNRFVKVKFK